MRRLNRLLAYLLLLLMPLGMGWGLPGCNACARDCQDQPFSKSVRAYLLGFKQGSYWIYRNTQNGNIDSVYSVVDSVRSYPSGASQPVCLAELGLVTLKGFADDKQLAYTIQSDNNIIISTGGSVIAFYGDYNTDQTAPLTVGGQVFEQVTTLTNCCISGRAYCYQPSCSTPDFRLMRLFMAREIGPIRWEAENYPGLGKVTYELVRYKVVR